MLYNSDVLVIWVCPHSFACACSMSGRQLCATVRQRAVLVLSARAAIVRYISGRFELHFMQQQQTKLQPHDLCLLLSACDQCK
jgi:hypothetical protein